MWFFVELNVGTDVNGIVDRLRLIGEMCKVETKGRKGEKSLQTSPRR